VNDRLEAEFANLLLAVWEDLQRPSVVWQVAALAACLLLAWALSRGVLRRATGAAAAKWQFGAEGLKRILFPLFALLLVVVARAALRPYMHVSLLDLAVPLAGSAALVRILVYTLRYVFAPSGVLAAFERGIALVVWGAFALYLVGVLPVIVEGLDAIEFQVGRQRISIWLVLQALFWATLTVLAALWVGSAIETRLMGATTLHPNLRVVFARLVKALLIVLAVVIALPLVGIDLTVLSVFGGALGVGIGLGLQRIASNYVSGFILLLERSIRLGDMITADQFYGEVKDITTRYVVVRALDGREAIIPNELLITTKVLNHSHANNKVRHALGLQVAYGADVERALRLMETIAARQPRVLKDPAPLAFLTGFAESGLALELGFWLADRDPEMPGVRSQIGLELLRTFRAEGIEIPFPQREVRILSTPEGGKLPPAPAAGASPP
jgi:small-conductance mechanosensitive channel